MRSEFDELDVFFTKLDRAKFMEFGKDLAPLDSALPIGYGQTISQPSLVLYMTHLLDLNKDCKTLEIGTGSGYQTAFLAQFSKEVYTVERIDALYEKAKTRLSGMGYDNITYKLGDGSYGWKENGPYDRIMVTASSIKVPHDLLEQLRPGGRMVIPVGPNSVQTLYVIIKDMDGKCEYKEIEKVRFVRLIGEYE